MQDVFFRRQKKPFLETCRRIAVVGLDTDSDSASFVATEKLLGSGLEILPVLSDRREFLGVQCYASLRDVAGKIDIVQIYPSEKIDLRELAREAVDLGAPGGGFQSGYRPTRHAARTGRRTYVALEGRSPSGNGGRRQSCRHHHLQRLAARICDVGEMLNFCGLEGLS